MHSHNHVMDPFNPQVPVQMFDQMKISHRVARRKS